MKKTRFVIIFYLILLLGFTVRCGPNIVRIEENTTPTSFHPVPSSESTAVTENGTVTSSLIPTLAVTPTVQITSTPTVTQVLTGELHIVSEPTGALVSISSENLNGQAPVTWTMLPGTYTVTLMLDGYVDWTTPMTVTTGSSITITATLHKEYMMIPIEEVNGLFSLQWADDGQSLIYATGNERWPSHVQTLPVYQNWWLYDVVTGDKQALPPPQTRVTNAVRESLEICPFPLPEIVPYPYSCSVNLQESPIHSRIVFSSSQLDDTWLANIDGSDVVYLDKIPGSPEDVNWSSNDQWLLIGHYNGISKTYYLVSSDGTFVESLEELTNTSHWRVYGPTPQFSPDGQKVAFVGIETGGRQLTGEQESQEDAYSLYVLDLNTLEYQLVSLRFGLFQWARDGSGLYVLDGSANTSGSFTTVSEVRYTDLYYIDLTQEPYLEERLTGAIPMYPRYTSVWAYSPEANAMAGEFDVHQSVFSIMLLE